MNKRTLILMAFVVFAMTMVGAPIAGANPVSEQYDVPSTTPPAVDDSSTPPVTDDSTVTPPATDNPSDTSPVSQVNGKTTTVKNAKPAEVTETAPVAAVPASGTLPFTGLDLGLFLVVGGVAVASGLALRRVAARRPEDS